MQLPLYKYMKKKYVHDFFKNGTIRIGTLYDFREIEKHGPEIGDIDEGTKTLTTDGYHMIDTADPSTLPSWLEESFQNTFKLKSESGQLIIHARDGIRVRLTVPDRFVFSVSDKFDEKLMHEFGYDSCIKINDPKEFFTALTNKMKHMASWMMLDHCIYRSRIIIGEHDIGLEPSLIKEERYSYQKEVRAIWEGQREDIKPFILKAKKARFLCEPYCT